MGISHGRENFHHRMAVVARLVQGSYNLQYNRQNESQDPPTSHGWEFCHFKLKSELQDKSDRSSCAAIYEHKDKDSNQLPESAPKYVIAIRGTIIKRETYRRDIFKLDMKILIDRLHKDHRFKHVLENVEELEKEVGAEKVWLAGHSLGSAIAMLVGQRMAQNGVNIKSFLFNLPFPYFKDWGLRFKIFISEKVGHVHQKAFEDQLAELSSWIPYLFVDKADPISKKYIKHFDQATGKKDKMRVHSQVSFVEASSGEDPKARLHILPKARLHILPKARLHILPKAWLTIRDSSSKDWFKAHGLKSWWHQMSFGPGFACGPEKVSIGDPVFKEKL